MFEDRLTNLRKARNMTMREVASQLGISYTTYVGYEKNEREPNSDVLIAIANYFNCSVDYLIGRDSGGANSTSPVRVENFNITEDIAKIALFGGDGEVTDDMWEEVKGFVDYIKNREKKKK